MNNIPPVAIGMPVYNGGNHLSRVLDSILGQTFRDFVLIISDNASTDNTGEVCKSYAERDARVVYVKQMTNIGAELNFQYVFALAKSKYFMWAAADDVRSIDFLELNFNFLENNPTYVGSTCAVRFEGGGFNEVAMGDMSLSADDPYQRIGEFFRTWHANGRYYSLFRRQFISGWKHLNGGGFLGSDWTLVTHMASQGKLNRLAEGWVELGRGGVSNTTDIFARYRKRPLDWFFPFNQVTLDTLRLMRGAKLSQLLLVTVRLIRLNLMAFVGQFRMMIRRLSKGN